jgi:hypothetical protein
VLSAARKFLCRDNHFDKSRQTVEVGSRPIVAGGGGDSQGVGFAIPVLTNTLRIPEQTKDPRFSFHCELRIARIGPVRFSTPALVTARARGVMILIESGVYCTPGLRTPEPMSRLLYRSR